MAEPEREVTVVMGPTKFGMSMRPEKAFRLHMDTALPRHNRTQQYNITIYRDGDYLHIDLSSIAEAQALLAAWNAHDVDSDKSVKMVLDGDCGAFLLCRCRQFGDHQAFIAAIVPRRAADAGKTPTWSKGECEGLWSDEVPQISRIPVLEWTNTQGGVLLKYTAVRRRII
ncbi:hypothetical protein B0H13DRAFT_1877293 [Mycena leptocephala]|nr:hypothetical protein B0H13DRAFT_1877293 [Mycena leptocephala]